MSTPWLAQTFFKHSPGGSKAPEDAGSSRGIASAITTVHNVRSAIDSEIQNVRSAIESKFKGPPSPKKPSEHAAGRRQALPPPSRREPMGLPGSPRPRPQALAPASAGWEKQQYSARTADPRAAQFAPDPRPLHRSRERRYGYQPRGPPPRFDGRAPPMSALPPGYNPQTPPPRQAPSHWPSEKTPTSPYQPRQPPPRSPRPAQVPHTAHPGGAFPRFDSPSEKGNSLQVPDSAPAKDPKSASNDKCVFLDSFNKVKAVISPRSPAPPNSAAPNSAALNSSRSAFASPAYSPIPPPQEKVPVHMGTRQNGFYEYQTPGTQTQFNPATPRSGTQAQFGPATPRTGTQPQFGPGTPRSGAQPHFGPGTPRSGAQTHFGPGTPRTGAPFDSVPLRTGTPGSHDQNLPPDWAGRPVPNAHLHPKDGLEGDDKTLVDEENSRPLTLKEKIQDFIVRLRLWIRRQLKRRGSRIPSFNADVEAQALDEIEKEIREAFTLSWCTLIGAWIVQFTTFGYIWSWGVFQDFLLGNYPDAHPLAKNLAWVGSLQLMMAFAFGYFSGKLFDSGKFHWAMMGGSLIFAMGCFTLSFIDPAKFIHLFLVQGLFMGTGLGLVFVPSCLIVQLHFHDRKALMTGIVMSGSSFGALVYPVMLERLLPAKGFNGGVRATAYMVVALLVIANCLMSVPAKKWQPKYPPPNLLDYLKDLHYAAACGALFLVFLTMWFPQYWIEEFAVQHGVNPQLSFYSAAIIAAGGMIGRPALGWAADRYGAWTMLLPTTFLLMLMICFVSVVKNAAAVVFVSLFYGLTSHAWLSLIVFALSTLTARSSEMGRYTGFALSVGSLGAFLGGSAQAALLSEKWVWARPIGLFAFMLILAIGIMVYVRHLMTIKRRTVYV